MGFSRQEYWSGLPLPSPNSPCKFNKSKLSISCYLRWSQWEALGSCGKVKLLWKFLSVYFQFLYLMPHGSSFRLRFMLWLAAALLRRFTGGLLASVRAGRGESLLLCIFFKELIGLGHAHSGNSLFSLTRGYLLKDFSYICKMSSFLPCMKPNHGHNIWG